MGIGVGVLILLIVVSVGNFFSLWMVVKKLGLLPRILFQNPAFLIGDFLLIPAFFVVIYLLLNFSVLFAELGMIGLFLIVALSILIAVFLGHYFNLLKPIWLPHGLIGWMVILCFLLYVVWELRIRAVISVLDFVPAIILLVHEGLGIIYPKRLGKS